MTYSIDKKLARLMMKRNENLKYTEALRKAKDSPKITNPKANLLVSGYAGFGSTVALQWIAMNLSEQGWDIESISLKEKLPKKLDERISEHQKMNYIQNRSSNPEKEYVRFLKKVELGSSTKKKFLILDNFDYIITPNFKDLPAIEKYEGRKNLQKLLEDPYTCVGIRLQSLKQFSVYPELMNNLQSRLHMGPIDSVSSQMIFREQFEKFEFSKNNRGVGYYKKYNDSSAKMVSIPNEEFLFAVEILKRTVTP